MKLIDARLVVATSSMVGLVWACGAPVGRADAGSGGGDGSAGGVVAAGGSAAGGSSGGSVAGGTAGGEAGGASAGGDAGGATAGGSAGGDAGGAAGGSVAGGAAGGATAGGSAGGSAGGAAGGSAGGAAGGSAGGAAGGSAGGAAGGSTNQPPFLTGIILTKGSSTTPLTLPVFAGQLLTLTPDVFDPENQPLTSSWSVVSGPDGGTFNDPTLPAPTWYSSDVTQNSDTTNPFPEWSIRVEVSDGTNPPVSFTQAVSVRAPRFSNILNDSVIGSTAFGGCSNSSCHGSTTTASGGFAINRFNASASYTAMLANHGKGTSCSIATKRVQAFNPSFSLLFRKLQGGVPATCGAQMPFQRGSVAPNELITIRSWINAGALQN